MGFDQQIHVNVSQDQKERWEDYIEDTSEHRSLSALIRRSVEREINSDQPEAKPSPAMETEIQSLLDDVDRIRKDVQWLRTQEQDEVDISGLAQEVFDHLETLPEPQEPPSVPSDVDDREAYLNRQAASMAILPEDAEEAESEGQTNYTASALADEFDTSEERIEDAITHLQDEFLPVVAVGFQGDTHYFKER